MSEIVIDMQQCFLLHRNEAKGAEHDMVRVIGAKLSKHSCVVGHKRHSDLTQANCKTGKSDLDLSGFCKPEL